MSATPDPTPAAPHAGIAIEPHPEPAPVHRAVGGRRSRLFTVLFVVAYFANMMAVVTPASISISLKLLDIAPDQAATAQSMVLGIGAIFAAVANPLGGYFSDRSTSRFGRRRPFLVLGAVIGLAGLGIMAASAAVPLLILGWAVTQVGFNLVFAVLYGLLADVFPSSDRGKMSGFIGLGQAVGIAGGVAIASLFPSMLVLTFLGPGIVALLLITTTAIIAPDRRQERGDLEPATLTSFLAGFWVSPRKHPDYGWAWLGRFLVIFAQTGATGFTVLFLVARFGFTAETVGAAVLLNTLLGLAVQGVSSPIGGWLSDKLGRRKIFVFLSAIVFTVGIVVIATATTVPMFFVGSAILQLGISAYIAVDLALVTDVLPDNGSNAAKHLGVLALANTIPQSLAPAAAPLFLGIGGGTDNYVALFVASAVVGIIGAASVYLIRSVR